MKKYFDLSLSEEKEYMLVPKKLADELEQANSREEQEKLFFDAIYKKKKDISEEIEALDDDLLMFKAFGTKYKNELDKIYNEQYEKIEQTWEKLNAGDSIYKKLKSLNDSVKGLDRTLEEVERKIKYMSVRNLENAMNVIDRFNNMSHDDRNLLEKLMEAKQWQKILQLNY